MMISHASETVMLFVDRLFLSRLSKEHMAAAMGGGLTSFVLTSLFANTVGYNNAIVAQYFGSGRKDQCIRATTQAIYVSLVSFPILLAFIPISRFFFQAVGLEAEQAALANIYLQILLAGSVMFVLRNALSGFFTGIGRTRVVMVANFAAMIVNIPANYILIFGKLGMPALGMKGAAIGTLCGSLSALVILIAVYLKTAKSVEFRGEGQWRVDGRLIKRLIRFGLPAGVETFLNIGAFNLFVQMMHSYGPDVAAAITITFNWDIVAFVPMLGLGIATTAIVAQHIGAGNHEEAEKATSLVLRMSFVYTGFLMALFIIGARPLVLIFASGFVGDSQEVVNLAVTMLRLAAFYTVADSFNLIFAGALRGAGDTVWIMRFSVILHWLLAVIAFVLVRVVGASPVLVWCTFIVMIIIMGAAMLLRFRTGKWRAIEMIEHE
jgi:multidrug resistance protein, MATE family